MKTSYFRSTGLSSTFLHHFGNVSLHSWKIEIFMEIFGKHDTCEPDLSIIKVLEDDNEIKVLKNMKHVS